MDEPSHTNEEWDLVIKPRSSPFAFNLKEFLSYRDLISLFIKRDIQTVYKQTVLGPLWFVIQPIISTIIYTFIFGNLAQLSTDGIPHILFYFSGTMLWTYFQTTLTHVSDTFVQNAGLFGKIYFPRLTVPLSKALSNMIALGIQLVALAAIYVYMLLDGASLRPTWGLLVLPLIVLWIAMLASGFGMVISALTKKYRDLRQLLGFGMHLWMYATPVVYPMSQIKGSFEWVIALNPVSAPLELFRHVLFGTGNVAPGFILSSAASTVVIFFFGLILFKKNENTFVDVV